MLKDITLNFTEHTLPLNKPFKRNFISLNEFSACHGGWVLTHGSTLEYVILPSSLFH